MGMKLGGTNIKTTRTIDVPGSPLTATVNAAKSGSTAAAQALQTAAKDDGGVKLRAAVAGSFLAIASLMGVPQAQAQQLSLPQTTALTQTIEHEDSLHHQQRFEQFLNGPRQVALDFSNSSVDARTKAAFDAFTVRVEQLLHRDAASLASGHFPVTSPTQAQTDALMGAFKDLLKEMPIGAFGERFEATIESATGALGDTRDLSAMRLGDLGDVGGDIAKRLIDDLRHDSPTTFYSIAGVAAAGAVTLGYTQGTDALNKLGIKPEVRTTLFDGVKLRLGVHAGPRFSDPSLTVGLSGQHQFDNGTIVRGGVNTRIEHLTGNARLGETRFDASVTTTTGFAAHGEVRTTGNFDPIDARLSVSQRFDNGWQVGAGASYTFDNGQFSSTLSAGRRFNDNVDVQFRGTYNNQTGYGVGVGATIRF